jgi:hypothetical protein
MSHPDGWPKVIRMPHDNGAILIVIESAEEHQAVPGLMEIPIIQDQRIGSIYVHRSEHRSVIESEAAYWAERVGRSSSSA